MKDCTRIRGVFYDSDDTCTVFVMEHMGTLSLERRILDTPRLRASNILNRRSYFQKKGSSEAIEILCSKQKIIVVV